MLTDGFVVAPRRRWARVVHAVVSVLMAIGTLLGGPIGEAVAAPARVTLDATATALSDSNVSRLFYTPLGEPAAVTRKTITNTPKNIFSAVSSGGNHTCALNYVGNIHCWGLNSSGQLGNGSLVSTASPVLVKSSVKYTQVSSGSSHTCALSDMQDIWCWGDNSFGQTGQVGSSNVIAPSKVEASARYMYVTSGANHTCALDTTYSAWCWGSNSKGQLGDNSRVNRNSPSVISGSLLLKNLSSGLSQTCGISQSDTLYCWGDPQGVIDGNSGVPSVVSTTSYLCGQDTTYNNISCTGTAPTGQFIGVSAGNLTCAWSISSSNCWEGSTATVTNYQTYNPTTNHYYISSGATLSGALGYPYQRYDQTRTFNSVTDAMKSVSLPSKSSGVFDIISVGSDSVCALNASKNLYCWGNNQYGKLGLGDFVTDASKYQNISGNWYYNEPCKAGAVSCSSTPRQVSGSKTWTQISVGQNHSCAIDSLGVTYCWGLNASGQVGNNDLSLISVNTPTIVIVPRTYSQTSSSINHSCGVTLTGDIDCWGDSVTGAIGDGFNLQRLTPRQVARNETWKSIETGRNYSCALSAVGSVYCWGLNALGQLGDGTTNDRNVPTIISTSQIIRSLSVGASHSCAVNVSGDALCWGNNAAGQLGDGTLNNRTIPTLIFGNLKWKSLFSGVNTTCGITLNAQLYCWGSNNSGQFGDGSTISSTSPKLVTSPKSFVSLVLTEVSTCGLTIEYSIYCWGSNIYGHQADPALTNSANVLTPNYVVTGFRSSRIMRNDAQICSTSVGGSAYCWGGSSAAPNYLLLGFSSQPTEVPGGLLFSSIAGGGASTCGVTQTGATYCWGANDSGQLGDASTITRLVPTLVGGNGWPTLAAGGGHTCGAVFANLAGAIAKCWGYNSDGQLGDGTNTSRSGPAAVIADPGWAQVASGYNHSCAITSAGAPFCWGQNTSGQVGDGSLVSRSQPAAVSGGYTFGSVTAGSFHSCGVTVAGVGYCWGTNSDGQLGNASTTASTTPVAVTGSLTWRTIVAGERHTCGLTTAGAAYCWGFNADGQLGTGTSTASTAPVAVSGSLTFASLETGDQHTCGLTTAGLAYCWGANGVGQLGIGSTTAATAPAAVAGAKTWTGLVGGAGHTCGIDTGGTGYCWGANANGQLGTGTTTASLSPTSLFGGAWRFLTAGFAHTCGVTTIGEAYCWGWNLNGQVGDGTTTDRTAPVLVGTTSVIATPTPTAIPVATATATATATPTPNGTLTATSTPTNTPTATWTASSTPTATPASGPVVEITNFAFSPATLTVFRGEPVRWINRTQFSTHSVTSTGGIWDSGAISPGGSYAIDFNTPGTYAYRSAQYPTMTGTIIVLDATVTPVPTATASMTASSTPVPTATPTPTASNTPVLSPTASATGQPSATATASSTATASATLAPSATATAVRGPVVTVSNFAFSPANLTVFRGEVVRFQNASSVTTHTVGAPNGAWSVGAIAPGGTGAIDFAVAGTYPFTSLGFAGMTGTITVLDATVTPLPTATATVTPWPTTVPSATASPTASSTPVLSPTASATGQPSATATASSTATASATLAPSATATAVRGPVVTVSNFAFSPANLTIFRGEVVRFQNASSVTTHTVGAPNGAWSVGSISPGGTGAIDFAVAGTYPFTSLGFAGMTGTITVLDATVTPLPSATATSTASPTTVPSATASPTASNTPVLSPTASATGQPSATATASSTATASATLSPPATATAVRGPVVSVSNFAFSPANLTVFRGEVVRFQNASSVTTHTVGAPNGAWSVGAIAPGGTGAIDFAVAGTYPFTSLGFAGMTGTITVLDATVTPLPTATATATAVPTGAPTLTASATASNTPVASPTATATGLPTASATATATGVPTASPTVVRNPLVQISNFAFSPASITVYRREPIRWTNTTAFSVHSVTSLGGTWDSGDIAPGQSFAMDIDTPGTYTYRSKLNPAMTGTITVLDATVTPFPTATFTATPSITPSATASATASATPTAVATAAPTASGVPTATVTASATATATPSATATPTTYRSPTATGTVVRAPVITITNFAFSPASVTVYRGEAIRWVNASSTTTHAIASTQGLWSSGPMAPGAAFMLDLDTAGTYPFASTQFPAMVGTIIVIDVTVTPGPSLTPSVTSSATASATASTTATPGATFTASATSTTTATPTATNTPVTGVKTRNLRVTNVREGGFTVNWTTSLATTGAVRWGLEGTTPANVATDVRGGATASTVHVVDVKGLLPATRYTFDVVSGDGVDANGGAHYPVLTGAPMAIPTPDLVSGQVLAPGGAPASLAIVVITIESIDGGATAISTLVQPTDAGAWVANLSTLRNIARVDPYAYTGTTSITVEALGGTVGSARSKTTVASARGGVAALTLAPTTQATTSMTAGWNLVTLPLDPVDPITSVGLCSALQGAAEVDRWEGGWDGHLCAIPANNFAIETGRGYFVRLTAPRTWTIEGTAPGSRLSFALQSGWNLVGFPGAAARLTAPSVAASIALAGGSSTPAEVVKEVDRWTNGQWEAHVVGLPVNAYALEEGVGYFVRALRPVTWANPGLTGTNRVIARDVPTMPEEDPPTGQ